MNITNLIKNCLSATYFASQRVITQFFLNKTFAHDQLEFFNAAESNNVNQFCRIPKKETDFMGDFAVLHSTRFKLWLP